MCAIAGYYSVRNHFYSCGRLRQSLQAMGHRGPDDEGISLICPEHGIRHDLLTENTARGVQICTKSARAQDLRHRIGIGHRRFSIVDTSPSGHQPFWSWDGKVCVAFNGEIYNYLELRKELEREGFRFHTASDTEVFALAYRAWGVECFQRFNGFWAASLYDQERRQVLLARDRIGKAPLYVARDGTCLYWASEIKGLFALMGTSLLKVREQTVVDFMRWHRRDLFHTTFYESVNSFPTAAYAWIEADGSYVPVEYWHMPKRRLRANEISIHGAGERLKELLDDAVRLRLRADVPVAVQLSGGVDSSTVLALAANNAPRIHAYTVSFPQPEANEESFARKVAEHYSGSVSYSVIEPPPDDLLVHADRYIYAMGEPFHSPNQFTNYRVWKIMAQQGIRVTLYGAGGDEVFAGYYSTYYLPYLRYLLQQNSGVRFLKEFFLQHERERGCLGWEYLRRACRLLPGVPSLYHTLIKKDLPAKWDPFVMPRGVAAHPGPSDDLRELLIDYMTHWRMNYWLRIDNQNSMSVPMELRLPFLDYRVVEFGCTLPVEFLIRNGWMKWILRSAMESSLPHDVVWRRRKMGFPFPLDPWLARFKERILSMIQPLDCPYLDMKKFVAGYETLRRDDPEYLWCLISLGMWWKRCVQGEPLS